MVEKQCKVLEGVFAPLWDEDLVSAGQRGGEGIEQLLLDQAGVLQLPFADDEGELSQVVGSVLLYEIVEDISGEEVTISTVSTAQASEAPTEVWDKIAF